MKYLLSLVFLFTLAASAAVSVDSDISGISSGSSSVDTDPVAYTPVFTGFGTVTVHSVTSWRSGGFLHVRGKFTSGTPTTTEARVSLGYNGTNGNITSASVTKIPSISIAGIMTTSEVSANVFGYSALIDAAQGYIVFGVRGPGAADIIATTGDGLVQVGGEISFDVAIPIDTWP